jgi:HTH-type transcriptional regulator / antitoxin HipB
MSLNDDIGGAAYMRIRTPAELGALIRDRRTGLRLDQQTLAQKVGVSRQWIVAIERGKSRAEIGLILRTMSALGIQLTARVESDTKTKSNTASAINIDSIVTAARTKRTR